ncbi:MAG TPA: NAD(P)-dependent oxidoreductase [Gammaproteobacteria bacterium]|nr:NAD(P)-dependent oxidoreductase [Gammaproteobacteria bacterium]
MSSLEGKTIFITGASRGIGRSIALKLATHGANIVITGKTVEKHPRLEGTIHSVAKEVETHGGRSLAIQLDIRDETQIYDAIEHTIQVFGGIDVLINNASAIDLTNAEEITLKKFDLMMGINQRGMFASSQACIPFLKKSSNPHILTLSPPIDLNPRWFTNHMAYTMSKYGMSLCTLGLSAELKKYNIAVNSLWPRTIIATAAIINLFPEDFVKHSRRPEIVADATEIILQKSSKDFTGQFLIDEEVLREAGNKNLEHYNFAEGNTLTTDLFLT